MVDFNKLLKKPVNQTVVDTAKMAAGTLTAVQPEEDAKLPTELQTQAHSLPAKAHATFVTNNEQLQAADHIDGLLAAMIKEITTKLEPNVKRWWEGHKAAKAEFNEYVDPLEAARKVLKGRMALYLQRKEEEQRQIQAAAVAAEAARARAAAEAEQVALAEQLLAEGDVEGAAEVISAEPILEHRKVEVERNTPKTGSGLVYTWSAEVTDLKALLQGIIDGKVPIQVVEPVMPVLNKQAEIFKSTWNWPGVKAVQKAGMRRSGR